jgi:hypothetical protein
MHPSSKKTVVSSGRVLALAVLLVQGVISQEGTVKGNQQVTPKIPSSMDSTQNMRPVERAGTVKSKEYPETRITYALPKIEGAFAKLNGEGRPVSQKSTEAVSFFRSTYPRIVNASSGGEDAASARYADTMEGMADVLTAISSGPIDAQRRAIQKDVEENLQIMHSAAVFYGAKDLPLRVKTVNKGKEDSGWEIFYMEYFYRSIRPEVGPESFPALSSPSKHRLPPSKYILQARKTATGEKSETKIVTLNGGQSQEIEISVK